MLIGLNGPAGCGKDTLADHLCAKYGGVKNAFAQPLRDGLQAMLGISPAMWADRAWKEQPITWLGKSPREMLQTLGTEWGRTHVNGDIWMLIAAHRYAEHVRLYADPVPFVIPDVRFDNEGSFILERGGKLITIQRPGVAAVAAHSSEAGLDPRLLTRAHVIVNDSDIPTFLERAERALEI